MSIAPSWSPRTTRTGDASGRHRAGRTLVVGAEVVAAGGARVDHAAALAPPRDQPGAAQGGQVVADAGRADPDAPGEVEGGAGRSGSRRTYARRRPSIDASASSPASAAPPTTVSGVERWLPGVGWGEAVRDGGRLEPVRRVELAQDV
jgi:hypothetical protein